MIAYLSQLTFILSLNILMAATVYSVEETESRPTRSLFSFGSRSSLTRSQLLDIPNVAVVVIALTFLIFLLPLRMLRFNSMNASAQNQTVKIKSSLPASLSVTEESAHLTRKILDAIENDPGCVNHTACIFASEVKKVGGNKQETILNMLEILLPAKWKPSVDVIKQAVRFKQADKFCRQFVCEENDVDLSNEPEDGQDELTTMEWVAAE